MPLQVINFAVKAISIYNDARVPRPMKIPLSLPVGPCWELEEGAVDSMIFLQALPAAFPETTVVFLEGSSIASDIVQVFEQYIDAGSYLPEPQTLWSTGTIKRFRCRFTSSLFEALASASQHHAEPELFDHISSTQTARLCLSGRTRSRIACGLPIPFQRHALTLSPPN
jgi:hypothetical protein